MSKIDFPKPIRVLISELKRLPGIGPRSAERMAIWLLEEKKSEPLELSSAIQEAVELTGLCDTCGFFTTGGCCEICDDERRDNTKLCIVERATDILSLERSGVFSGSYHCLGGKISPLDGISPEDLRIVSLLERIDAISEPIEVILALGADVEGEATSNYLAEILQSKDGVSVSRIAQGLPVGSGLGYADELTLIRALQGRTPC